MILIASIMNLAGPDLIVILLIVLVLFGAKKLPELARGMGQAVKEFQKAKDEFSDELHKAERPTPRQHSRTRSKRSRLCRASRILRRLRATCDRIRIRPSRRAIKPIRSDSADPSTRLTCEQSDATMSASAFMSEPDLRTRIKEMLVKNLMLQTTADQIGDDLPLFGPNGLGLDSIDALELVVSMEKTFGVGVPNSEVAGKALRTVNTIHDYILEKRPKSVKLPPMLNVGG